jgi:hypothetical protein
VVGAAVLLLASAFCTPGVWWARNVPQLWLLPTALVVLWRGPAGAWHLQRGQADAGRLQQGLCWATGLVLAVDLLLVAQSAWLGQLAATRAAASALPEARR